MTEKILDNSFQKKFFYFMKKKSKIIIISIFFLIFILFSYLFYNNSEKKNAIKIAENYTHASIKFKEKKTNESKQLLENIINEGHRFYSPLALNFIIDNNLETDNLKIINFYDKILSIRSIESENINLIKIKKAIFLFNLEDEKAIIKTLNPIINSESVWKNVAVKLIADYFLSKNQKSKANEYIQLLNNKNKK
jgi:predicted negative regulator of RcsB-dependent stress response